MYILLSYIKKNNYKYIAINFIGKWDLVLSWSDYIVKNTFVKVIVLLGQSLYENDNEYLWRVITLVNKTSCKSIFS